MPLLSRITTRNELDPTIVTLKLSGLVKAQKKNMSLHPQGPGPIPEETVRVAHAICPRGTLSMRIQDEL